MTGALKDMHTTMPREPGIPLPQQTRPGGGRTFALEACHDYHHCAFAQTATAATGILIPLPPLKKHTYELPDGVALTIVGGIYGTELEYPNAASQPPEMTVCPAGQ